MPVSGISIRAWRSNAPASRAAAITSVAAIRRTAAVAAESAIARVSVVRARAY